jgi:hypothetical protein
MARKSAESVAVVEVAPDMLMDALEMLQTVRNIPARDRNIIKKHMGVIQEMGAVRFAYLVKFLDNEQGT